jgi:hypothetical protein
MGFYKIKLCFLQSYICNLPSTSLLHSYISFICDSRSYQRGIFEGEWVLWREVKFLKGF